MAIVAMKTERLHENALMPIQNDNGAACFQLAALVENPDGDYIGPGGSLLIRTGLKFTIPNSWVIELYPRRANALDGANVLGTRVGLLDNKFTDEVTVELVNHGKSIVRVMHGDIIADGLLTQIHGARFIDAATANAAAAPADPSAV